MVTIGSSPHSRCTSDGLATTCLQLVFLALTRNGVLAKTKVKNTLKLEASFTWQPRVPS